MILNSLGATIAPIFDSSSNLGQDSTCNNIASSSSMSQRNAPSREQPSTNDVLSHSSDKKVRKASDAQDIVLPNQISNHTHVAIDIGGTLAKIVYYSPNSSDGRGGRLNFAKFQTNDIENCIQFLVSLIGPDASKQTSEDSPPLAATGGGAHKFFSQLSEAIAPRKVIIVDEISCLISGVDYFISQVPDEVFHYVSEPVGTDSNIQYVPTPEENSKYPYLLVNIGSGVSIIKVTGQGQFERVSGTSLGGGTFWGLASLLTGLESFDEILELSQSGQNKNVDMLVGDIYGQDYQKIGLKATAIASSMGKVYRKDLRSQDSPEGGFRPEDICASLLFTVSNNIGQIAYLNACAHKVQNIYFGGYFIRGHPVTMHTLQYAINFWSGGTLEAKFLRHEGYLGAMGSLLNLNTNH